MDEKQSIIIGNYSSWVRAIAFNNDDTRFAVAKDDGKLIILKKSDQWENSLISSEIKTGIDWITSIDYDLRDPLCLATATLSGKIVIMTKLGQYNYKMKAIVNQIKFIPRSDNYLYLAVATNGKGLQILSAVKMKFE